MGLCQRQWAADLNMLVSSYEPSALLCKGLYMWGVDLLSGSTFWIVEGPGSMQLLGAFPSYFVLYTPTACMMREFLYFLA
jgi:hypothetical protein